MITPTLLGDAAQALEWLAQGRTPEHALLAGAVAIDALQLEGLQPGDCRLLEDSATLAAGGDRRLCRLERVFPPQDPEWRSRYPPDQPGAVTGSIWVVAGGSPQTPPPPPGFRPSQSNRTVGLLFCGIYAGMVIACLNEIPGALSFTQQMRPGLTPVRINGVCEE